MKFFKEKECMTEKTKFNFMNHLPTPQPNQSRFALVFLLFMTFLLGSVQGWGQIQQRGTATTANNAATTVTINKPSGLQVGDIMIATINQVDNDDNTLAAASRLDWTGLGNLKYHDESSNQNEWWGTVLYKVATQTDVAGLDFQFNGDNDADNMQGCIVAFSGGNPNNPIDVTGTFTKTTGSNTSVAPSGITTLTNNAAVIMLAMSAANITYSSWATTNPSTLNELFDINYSSGTSPSLPMSMGGAWATKVTPGDTGNGSSTTSNNARDGSLLIALRCTPSITSQSTAAQSVCAGTSFNPISVTASGTNLTYQWYRNTSASNSGGTSLGTATGAQTSTYTPLNNVASGTNYYYYCIESN